jgi:predicted nuclease of predicted toxin-antitoxin system
VKFLVDNQLPGALSKFLVSLGHDCQHVLDVDLEKASDAEIWRYAGKRELIVISKDEDFLFLAGGAETKARFLWVRFGNCRTSALLSRLQLVWPRVEGSFTAGERVVELR